MRACVFACGHSSRHQPLSLTGGVSGPSPYPVSLPSWPPAPPPPRVLRASGRPVQSSDSQVQVRRARRASQRSRFTLPPPLTSRPVRSAHSAFTLLEFTGCGSARPHSLDAVCRRTGTPLGCSPRLFLSFDRVFTVTRSPRDPNLAPLCWGLSLSVIRTLARPAISSGDFRCRLSIGPWDMIQMFHFLGYSSPLS